MRIIFLFFSLFFSIVCFSQDDKPPTQKEIEAQKQEAIKEAKQQLTDLKKDIAQAKADKSDPESIQEMEKQLAMLEKMVAMLEKANLSGKPKSNIESPVKTVEPKYVSPFTPIGLKQTVSIPTEKEATDQLFWYKGKKIDANTLITTSGTIVRYDRANHRLIYEPKHGPDPDTLHSYYGLLHTLKQAKQIKNLFASDANGLMNGFFMYPGFQAAYDEIDLINKRYYDVAVNTIQPPQVSSNADVEKMIQDLTAHAKNLPAIQKIILPPKRPTNICLCEIPDEVAKYADEMLLWLKNFFSDETDLMNGIMQIIDELELLKSQGNKLPNFYFASYFILAFERANTKLEKLLNEYEGDLENIVLEDALVYAKRELEKLAERLDLKTLSTMTGSSEYSRLQNLSKQVKDAVFSSKFDDYILFKKKDKEFNIVFDYNLYVSHEYNKKWLSPGYNINNNIQKWLKGLEDYNRFTLSVKIEFEYEAGDGDTKMTANGEFNSQTITTSLGIEDCLFNLRVTDANYRDKNGDEEKLKIPLTVSKGVKQYPKKLPMFYSGPSTVMMLFPRFKLSFCGDPSEVKLDLLTYKPSDIQQHSSDDVSKVYTMDMLAYANKMFLGLVKTYTNLNDLINTGDKMMNMNDSPAPASTGNRFVDEMRMEYKMNEKRYDLQYDQAAATHTGKTILKLGTLSPQGSPILGPNPFDLVDQFDQDRGAVRITYAYITLDLIHTPK